MTDGLLVVDRHNKPMHSSLYRKEPPPKLGEQFAPGWASEGKPTFQLPGGGLLMFDLDRLTLQDYRAMRNHYQINISVTLLSFMVHQVNWRIEGGDAKVRKFVEENLREVWGRLIRATSSAYWAGYAGVVLQYENDGPNDRIKLVKFKDLEPEKAKINWKEVDGYTPRGGIPPKIRIYDGIKVEGHRDPVPPENCVHPDVRILCADFQWRRAGDLPVGAEIITFDEEDAHLPGGRGGRSYRKAHVVVNRPGTKLSVEVSTAAGTITASTDHPFLVRVPAWKPGHRRDPATGRMLPNGGGWPEHWEWRDAKDLKAGDQIAYIGDVWDSDWHPEAAWFGGMLDGEGHMTKTALGVSQRPGPVLDRMKAYLDSEGFTYDERDNKGCTEIKILGGWREHARLLARTRPTRFTGQLLERADGLAVKIGKSVDLVEVESVSDVGRQAIASIQTSTGTFITDGYLTHNTLWYPLLMEAGDHHGRKLLKPAFPSWFFSQIIHLYVNRYFERFGEPLPVGRAPFGDTLDDGKGGTISGKKAMENVLDGIRNRAIVTLPSDRTNNPQGGKTDYEYTIEYLESQMRGADFERYLDRLDEEMSLGIFTPVLLYRTADVGSYNLGEAHMQMFLIMTNALVDDLAEYINRYIVGRLIDVNFGRNARKDVRLVPKKMGEAAQATLRQIAMGMIQGGLAKVDLDDLGLSLGMTLTEIKQVTGEEGAPAASSSAGTGDPTDRPAEQA